MRCDIASIHMNTLANAKWEGSFLSLKRVRKLGGVWQTSLSNVVWVFLICVWMKKCVEMCVSVFKMLKKLLEMPYQTSPNVHISSTSVYSEHPCNSILKCSKMITIIESDLNNPWKGREGPRGLSSQKSLSFFVWF